MACGHGRHGKAAAPASRAHFDFPLHYIPRIICPHKAVTSATPGVGRRSFVRLCSLVYSKLIARGRFVPSTKNFYVFYEQGSCPLPFRIRKIATLSGGEGGSGGVLRRCGPLILALGTNLNYWSDSRPRFLLRHSCGVLNVCEVIRLPAVGELWPRRSRRCA